MSAQDEPEQVPRGVLRGRSRVDLSADLDPKSAKARAAGTLERTCQGDWATIHVGATRVEPSVLPVVRAALMRGVHVEITGAPDNVRRWLYAVGNGAAGEQGRLLP
ncbi:hypothetical protein [Kribbella swartbergensis]